MWRSLVARLVRDEEAVGSNPATPTTLIFNQYFSPPLATSTFHDFVNKGKIIPMKGIRGFYLLNESLRRMGLREVRKIPTEENGLSLEDIVRLAFHIIDEELFFIPLPVFPLCFFSPSPEQSYRCT